MPLSPRHAEIIATSWRASYVLAPDVANASPPWCVLAIPKNACRELKRVALRASGHEPAGLRDADLHPLAQQRVGLSRLAPPDRSARLRSAPLIAILRDPLERRASAYADKLVSKTRPVEDRAIYERVHPGLAIDEAAERGVSFAEFCSYVCDTADADLDMHFKAQTNYLGEVEPDAIGLVPSLRSDLHAFAQRFGLNIPLPAEHLTSAARPYSGPPLANLRSGQLRALGQRPPAAALLTPELAARLRRRFASDLARLPEQRRRMRAQDPGPQDPRAQHQALPASA